MTRVGRGSTRPEAPTPIAYEFAKRAFDVLISATGLVVGAPAFLIVAGLVRLSSPGPVFYRGERTGLNGRPFRIWKFRTMYAGSEELGTTTRLGDSRVTRLGATLRRYKIDELPQLLNVFTGEMSIVGPRPEVREHTDAYTGEEVSILSVRPGITDYSSIRFASLDEELGTVDPHGEYLTRVRPQKNALRVAYVRQRSFVEDVRIVGATLRVLVEKAFR